MNSILRKSVVGLFISLIIFANLSCKKSDPFETPQATLRTFIESYNAGDTKELKKCGIVDDLLKALTVEDEHAGLMRRVPVMDLQLNIISCNFLRPDLTKRFTTEKSVCKCEFTSKSNTDFYLKQDIFIAKKRHSFQDFSETSRWQIMSIAEKEEDF